MTSQGTKNNDMAHQSSTPEAAAKKLTLTRSTVKRLTVRTDVKTGWGTIIKDPLGDRCISI